MPDTDSTTSATLSLQWRAYRTTAHLVSLAWIGVLAFGVFAASNALTVGICAIGTVLFIRMDALERRNFNSIETVSAERGLPLNPSRRSWSRQVKAMLMLGVFVSFLYLGL
jgi:hypothetical protein